MILKQKHFVVVLCHLSMINSQMSGYSASTLQMPSLGQLRHSVHLDFIIIVLRIRFHLAVY